MQSLRNLRKKNQNYNTHWMVAVGDSHGRVRPEPMQKKPTKFSWWKSVKIRNDNFCSVTRDILDRSKFKCICLSFNEITTPFSVNAQFHLCSTVWALSQKDFRSISKSPKMTHHFLKRAKRATDLFKTFNLTIGLQKQSIVSEVNMYLNFALFFEQQ